MVAVQVMFYCEQCKVPKQSAITRTRARKRCALGQLDLNTSQAPRMHSVASPRGGKSSRAIDESRPHSRMLPVVLKLSLGEGAAEGLRKSLYERIQNFDLHA